MVWAFFRGWRRKLGLLTLVMACVFMVGWVRSHADYAESVDLSLIQIVSSNGSLEIYDPKGFRTETLELADGRVELVEQNLPLFEIDYIVVVIPLTVLTSWLMLSNPGKPAIGSTEGAV
ncbi:hypothetical protein [Schlesneria sp. T3-172]|uniref:hypothetical protein n=1 Tax=Schlesneria sphaerica TaxID=3373610 RepID=UPI0037C7D5A3